MSNDYYNNSVSMSPFTLADANVVDADLNGIAAGFDKLPAPHANSPTTKGFSEVFKVVDASNEDNPPPVSQIRDAILVGTDTGTANTYVVTLTPTPGAYTTGMLIIFKPLYSNTGACTVNVNTMGEKTIKSTDGGTPAANEIYAGNYVMLIYDGTYFQILTASMSAVSVASVTIPAASGAYKNLQVNSAGTGYELGPPAIGQGQSWASYLGSRAVDVEYTNSTGSPIAVSVKATGTSLEVDVGGVTISTGLYHSFIVPSGTAYIVNSTAGEVLTRWAELR